MFGQARKVARHRCAAACRVPCDSCRRRQLTAGGKWLWVKMKSPPKTAGFGLFFRLPTRFFWVTFSDRPMWALWKMGSALPHPPCDRRPGDGLGASWASQCGALVGESSVLRAQMGRLGIGFFLDGLDGRRSFVYFCLVLLGQCRLGVGVACIFFCPGQILGRRK